MVRDAYAVVFRITIKRVNEMYLNNVLKDFIVILKIDSFGVRERTFNISRLRVVSLYLVYLKIVDFKIGKGAIFSLIDVMLLLLIVHIL